MATDSIFLPMTHCASHCDSCGQTRPQIDGKMLDFVDRLERRVDVAHQQVADEAGDVDRHRAAGDAGRLLALDAALGLAEASADANSRG